MVVFGDTGQNIVEVTKQPTVTDQRGIIVSDLYFRNTLFSAKHKGNFVVPCTQCCDFEFQKLFGHQMAEFRISIDSMWQNDGTFETFTDTHQEPIVSQQVKIKPIKGKHQPDNRDYCSSVPLLSVFTF